ncbi:MAG TPA: hypothetical protein VLF68_02905 [Candidatus Saccharimonadales bacterium]|nr:hypothetical protein [Candidatus Saccharimonadales bacterium]
MNMSELQPQHIIDSAQRLHELHGIVVAGNPTLSPEEQTQVDQENRLFQEYRELGGEYARYTFQILKDPAVAEKVTHGYTTTICELRLHWYIELSLLKGEPEIVDHNWLDRTPLVPEDVLTPTIFPNFVEGVERLGRVTLERMHKDALKTDTNQTYGEEKMRQLLEGLVQANGILREAVAPQQNNK